LVDLTEATIIVAATNVLVAIATITIASVAYKQMLESRRQARQQLNILSDQTAILRSQQDPLLKAHAFNFKGNELSVKLINRGKGRARRIGVETWFYPVIFLADQQGKLVNVSEQMVEDYKKSGQDIRGRYVVKSDAPLKYQKWQSGEPWYYVSFLASNLTGDGLLEPGEDQEFGLRRLEPVFRIWLDGTNYIDFKYSDLKMIIKDSGFQFVSISFRIACKDSVDRPVYGESFRCIADVYQNQTLEEAMREKRSLSFEAIDAHEVEKEMGGIDGELYKLERAVENFPAEQKEKAEQAERLRGSRFFRKRRKPSRWSKFRRRPSAS
jgi:hypothetical protein